MNKQLISCESEQRQLQFGTVHEFKSDHASSCSLFEVDIAQADAICVAYRESSCWMSGGPIASFRELPMETQFILFKSEGVHCIMVACVKDGFRAVFESAHDPSRLLLRIYSGDESVAAQHFAGFYVAFGEQPHDLMKRVTHDLSSYLTDLSPLEHKKLPAFHGYFGWCTWNAYYQHVSEEKLLDGIEDFREKGVVPGMLIIDDGWQSSMKTQEEQNFMVGNKADQQKFPEGLGVTTEKLRALGVKNIMAWMAYGGYWHGAEQHSFPDIEFVSRKGRVDAHLVSTVGEQEEFENDATVGPNFVPTWISKVESCLPLDWKKWYDHIFKSLSDQGIDGIKIDAMTWVEAFGAGRGGRAEIMKQMLMGIEIASDAHFDGQVLYCSSCSNDYFLQSGKAVVTRTSTDYFPEILESHGKHIEKNAICSFFTSGWVLPDWDMFQTSATAAEYHAAARAISGGPIYISDIPKDADEGIIKSIAFGDGRLPKCKGYAQPTEDTLYGESKLIKVFNETSIGAVLGVFNPSHDRVGYGVVRVEDMPFFDKSKNHLMMNHKTKAFKVLEGGSYCEEVICDPLGYHLYHFTPIDHGFAAMGLMNMLNSGGCIEECVVKEDRASVKLMGAGLFSAYLQSRPILVMDINLNKELDFNWDEKRLTVRVDAPSELMIVFSPSV